MKRLSHSIRIAAVALLTGVGICVTGCGETGRSSSSAKKASREFPRKSDLTEGEDGLFRVAEKAEPYTGVVLKMVGDSRVAYFASFQDGKRHGPDVTYHENGNLERIVDYHFSEKVRQREWFENGNPKIDAMMKDGVAFGRHLRWYEDGSTRFAANFIENLLWDGHAYDITPEGKVKWDAQFKDGSYVSGVYPEEFQEQLLAAGLVKPEEALFPIQDTNSRKAESERD